MTGYTFTLENYPTAEVNQEYLLMQTLLFVQDNAQHSGQDQHFTFSTRFELHPTREVFRPQRTVSKPHTKGPQSAIVTGPAGQEIWTDQYGRVKVQFGWDRYGKMDENSSCWIRVSYPWAGKGFGMIQIPRIGQEVLVDFKTAIRICRSSWGVPTTRTPCRRGDCREWRRRAGSSATRCMAGQRTATCCVLTTKRARRK